MVETVTELQLVEQFGGAGMAFGGRQARIDRRNFDVFLRGRCRDQVIALEDEAEGSAPQCCQRVGIECRYILAVEQILSAARAVETAQNVHQRRLAGAGCAHDRNEFASLNIERNAVQHLNGKIAVVIGLADIGEPDERRVGHGIIGHEAAHQNRRMPGLRPRCPAAASAPLEALVTITLSPSSSPLMISVCTRLRTPI